MTTRDAIRRVSVLSTGHVQIRPDHEASTWRPTLWWLLTSRPLMMVGDLTYDVHLFDKGRVPGVGNRRQLRRAAAMISKMRESMPGLVILPAHDPGAAERLARAINRSRATTAG